MPGRLPRAGEAIVSMAKVRDYLLSLTHRHGRSKARFFRSLGYSRQRWRQLQADLKRVAVEGTATRGRPNAHGHTYEVRATLEGESGRRARIITIWIILDNEKLPRFVTAHPDKKP